MGKSILIGLLGALLAAPLVSHAAGLGRLSVKSSLGQPLNAEVEIVSVAPGEEEGLTARLASSDAFRQAGVEFNPVLLNLGLNVERQGNKYVVRLTSKQPVNEPFLDVLIELQWPTGRLVREYTFLLDPPEYRAPQVAVSPPAAPAPKPAPRVEAPAPVAAAPAAVRPSPGSEHKVARGDTLGKIARAHVGDGVNLNQMLIALYRANRDAFIRNNINLVRAGRILRVPSRDEAAAVNPEDAVKLVRVQMADFATYRRSVAAAAPEAAPASGERTAEGRISRAEAAPADGDSKDSLKLSKADPKKPGAAGSRAAREDDRVATRRALEEAQSRVSELEKNVADLQKLLEIKNQQVAELEKAAAAGRPTPPKTAAVKPVAAKPEAPKPEAPKPEPAKPAPEKPAPAPAKPAAEKPAAEPAKPAAQPEKPAAPVEKPAAAAEKPAPKPPAKPKPRPAPPPPPPPPSLVDEFLDNPIALGGLGGVLALLVGYGAWQWRRKRAAHSKVRESVLGPATPPGGAASVFNAPAAAAAAAGSAAAATAADSSSQTSMPGMEAEEVDPIAEADVYMAYGRDTQAEEILREALQKDPNRIAVHAKLLEIYAGRRDAKAFEKTALQLKGLANGEGEEWVKAAALGRSIDPGNGLYGEGAPAESPTQAPAVPGGSELDFDLDVGGGAPADSAEQQPAAEATASVDFDLGSDAAPASTDFAPGGTVIMDSTDGAAPGAESGSVDMSGGLDFDLGGGDAAAPGAEAPVADDGGISFDIGAPTEVASEEAAPAEGTGASGADSGSIDFDLDLDLGGGDAASAPAAAAAPDVDLASINLDLDVPGDGGGAPTDPKWQEVATKLDLAKAYEEMGDKDGARELLNEVMNEGDAGQKAQAQEMLAKLG